MFAYYDNEGAESPLPAEQVLSRLAGLTTSQLASLQGGQHQPQGRQLSDRLTLLEVLGEGGMGEVYRGYDRVLRRVVAVKLIRADRLGGDDARRYLARFQREAQAMARVRHPACVAIHDAGLSPQGHPYLVMEHVAGKPLSALMTETTDAGRTLDTHQVARWGKAVAEGLQACHDAGVVHRDVKPANVLIDPDGLPHLTDFGIAFDAQAQTKLTAEMAAIGTMAYLPPEQAGGERVDPRADVYSVGATLYEALTGKTVFEAPLALALLQKIVSEPPRPLRDHRPGLPADLENVVLKCLAKEREDRYASAQALALDLARFLAGEPVRARPLSAAERIARLAWSRRRLLATAALAATVLGGGLIALQASRRASRQAVAESDLRQATSSLAAITTVGQLESIRQTLTRVAALRKEFPALSRDADRQLRALRGKRWLLQADTTLGEYRRVQLRAVELERRRTELLRAVDPRIAPARSPRQRELIRIEAELSNARSRLGSLFGACDRLLAQAGVESPGTEVNQRLARLYLFRGKALELNDPAAAERYLRLAMAADEAADGSLASRLRSPVIRVRASHPAKYSLHRYAFDPRLGHEVLVDCAQGTTPVEISTTTAGQPLAPGEFLLRLQASERVEARVPLLLARGAERTIELSLPVSGTLSLLQTECVYVRGGFPRSGRSLRPSQSRVADQFIRKHETTMEEWASFLLVAQAPATFFPRADPAEGRRLVRNRRFPVFGVSFDQVRVFCRWFQAELDLRRIPYAAHLPSRAELHWAVRGEFPWPFPWGSRFHPAFCAMADSTSNRVAKVLSFPLDRSPFGVADLTGSVAEYTRDPAGDRVTCFGGDLTVDSTTIRNRMLGWSEGFSDQELENTGFRYALVPKKLPPLPPANPTRAQALLRQAQLRFRQRKTADAFRLINQALKLDRMNPVLWRERAAFRANSRDWWGAAWDFHRVTELTPKQAEGWVNLGMVRKQRGERELAIAALSKGLELARPGSRLQRLAQQALGKLGR